MSQLYINAKTVPLDTEFPGTVQGLLNLLAQYTGIVGNENIIGLNFGPSTPTVGDRDKPWFKVTSGGAPIGLFSWNGAQWIQTPLTSLSGTTSSRPVSPSASTQYFDTDINCALIFERGKWRTITGNPGDIKFVAKTTLAAAITQNPGWIEFADARGRVMGAAGSGPGLTARAYNEKAGTETVTLTTDEIPAHAHETAWKAWKNAWQNGPQDAGMFPVVTGAGKTNTTTIGGDKAHDNMQPSIFLWCLIKE